MITFKYTKERSLYSSEVNLEVTTRAEHMKAVVEDFKTFLRHVGFHADNVDCVVYTDIHEERQGLPQQIDWVNGEGF